MQETATRPSAAAVPPRVLRHALFAGMKAVFRMWALCRLRVPPEALVLSDLLQDAPELAAALRDPRVLILLRDPVARRDLAAILHLAAHGSPDAAPVVH